MLLTAFVPALWLVSGLAARTLIARGLVETARRYAFAIAPHDLS